MSTERFYYRYCRKGHFNYSSSPIDSNGRCIICGQTFIIECTKCYKPLVENFLSPVYMGSGEPVYPPTEPPRHCPKCGAAYPWNSRIRNAMRLIRAVSARFRDVLSWRGLVKIIKAIIEN